MNRIHTLTTSVLALGAASAASASWYFTTDEVGVVAELVGENLIDPVEVGANRTYRLYAVVPAGWRIDAVAGNADTALHFEAVGGTFFQSPFGGWTSKQISAGFFALAPSLEWDSFITIGALDNAGGGTNASSNVLNTVNIDSSEFENNGGVLHTDNGAIFITPDDLQGQAMVCMDSCNRQADGVLVAQLTLLGEGATITGSMLVQGSNDLNEAFQHHVLDFTIDPDGVSDAGPAVGCGADLSGDDRVDVMDLLMLIDRWDEGACQDITGDLQVTADDLLALCDSWGTCTE